MVLSGPSPNTPRKKLGVDPRVSYIAGMGIRGAFNAQDDPKLTVTQEIAKGVAGGLLSG